MLTVHFIYRQSGEIDVVSDEPPVIPPYDQSKAQSLMTECERNISFARVEEIPDDWEDRITK